MFFDGNRCCARNLNVFVADCHRNVAPEGQVVDGHRNVAHEAQVADGHPVVAHEGSVDGAQLRRRADEM